LTTQSNEGSHYNVRKSILSSAGANLLFLKKLQKLLRHSCTALHCPAHPNNNNNYGAQFHSTSVAEDDSGRAGRA
jgi:hypothetical protein